MILRKSLSSSSLRNEHILRYAAWLLCVLLLLFLVTASLHRKLDHDEHQFIASAYLFAEKGFLPWVHYPYFHVPYLIFPYALLFQLTDHLLLAARLFSVTCSVATIGLITLSTVKAFEDDDPRTRFRVTVGSAALLVANPFFAYASGVSWNHDASVLLSVAATLTFLAATRSSQPAAGMLLSGILLGTAIGTRLSVAPLLLPFAAGTFFLANGDDRCRISFRSLRWLALGVTLALVPLLIFYAAAPDDFVFGNLRYAALNTEYRRAIGYHRAMSPVGKLSFLVERVLIDPGNILIFVLLAFAAKKASCKNVRTRAGKEVVFLLALFFFALLGSMAPTPSWYQYFYAPLPFLLLAALHATALSYRRPRARRALLRLFTVVVTLSCLRGAPEYWKIFFVNPEKRALATQAHRIGLEIRDRLNYGRVLTLAPIYPLEGGLEIYEAFASGPFAWRTSEFLSPADRQKYGIIAPGDLRSFLSTKPPDGILVGLEVDLERPLIEYAQENAYRPALLPLGLTLWISPSTADASQGP
ncbi:MAG: hypothetical protein AMS25_00245 [Gemmatimonas sp. SM23_52]|nr:MAG: hypothetical protein AMS25_00245 [Gemmatimonas sp. SM23_52]